MSRKAAVVIILLIFTLLKARADATHSQSLACYSMNAARRMLEANEGSRPEVARLGRITRPLAVVVDNIGDLILVGERDPLAPDLRLDDLVVALRTADSLEGGGCPGASIEQKGSGSYPARLIVRYFGGIENTHYGKVCFEADLLLKRWAFGFEPTGMHALPNDWDLYLDRTKSGYRQEPWVKEGGRRFFFPAFVKVATSPSSAVLHTCKIAIKAVEIGTEETEEGEEQKYELTVYDLFSETITQNYDKIAQEHPVLEEFRNLTALSALMKAVRQSEPRPDIDYWLKTYHLEPIETPKEIATVRRGVSGFAYGLSLSGGVIVCPIIYRARAGDPVAIRQLVLRSRPSLGALTWTISLKDSCDLTQPLLATKAKHEEALSFAQFLMARGEFEDAISRLTTVIRESDSSEFLLTRAEAYASLGQNHEALQDINSVLEHDTACHNAQDLKQAIVEGRSVGVPLAKRSIYVPMTERPMKPIETPGWLPPTVGLNLFEFKGRQELNLSWINGLYDLGFYHPMTLTIVLNNNFETSVTLPLELHSLFTEVLLIPVPTSVSEPLGLVPLPISEPLGLVGGVGDLTLSVRGLLLDGLWKKPSLIVGTELTVPSQQKFVETYSERVSGGMNLGSPVWQSLHSLECELPVFEHFHLKGLGYYLRYWERLEVYDISPSDYESDHRKTRVPDILGVGGGIRFPFAPTEKRRLCGVGLLYEQLIPVQKHLGQSYGTEDQYILFLDHASQDGILTAFWGVGVRGRGEEQEWSFFSSIGFGSKPLWSVRKWF